MTDVTPAARATILGEAADALGHMDYDADSSDYGYDSYRDAWDGGVMDGAALLRRMADAASPQPQAEGPAPGAELRETANFYEQVLANMLDGSLHPAYMAAIRDVICGLRRRADEAVAAGGPTAGVIPLPDADECGPNCPCRRSETEDGTATDEDRATRRTTIREKLDLLGQRGILGRAAVELLRELVEAEIREGNAAREERESLRFSLDMAQGRLNGLQQMHATTVAVNGTIVRELKARTVCTCAPPRAELEQAQAQAALALTSPSGAVPMVGVGMPAALHLDAFGREVDAAFGHLPYLVGSAAVSRSWRDVDVRLILPDEEFDALFPAGARPAHQDGRWSLLCAAISELARQRTGLPVDFQIQRMTYANERFPGVRHALGIHDRNGQ